jgi:hypothetical protein
MRPLLGVGGAQAAMGRSTGNRLDCVCPDAIILTDCAGVIRPWNLGAEAPFGHRAAAAGGHILNLSVPEPSRTAAHQER